MSIAYKIHFIGHGLPAGRPGGAGGGSGSGMGGNRDCFARQWRLINNLFVSSSSRFDG